jgi:N-formylglutamate amidohydrolase
VNIPIKEGYVADAHSLTSEMLKLTDWYTDDLFYSDDDDMIRADFSRIFCDPERFTEDSQEIMSQYGMGVLYEKNDEGDVIRNVTPVLKEKVLDEFYWPHHHKLNEAVNNQLNLFGKALIIDCHSYPSIPLKRDLNKNPKRPDFNIGTDPFHTPKHFIDISIAFFNNAGYTLGIDWPYKGSIVPLAHYNKNKNVQSIMLEINRALYLKEPSNEKSERYAEIKKLTADFIKTIRNSL